MEIIIVGVLVILVYAARCWSKRVDMHADEERLLILRGMMKGTPRAEDDPARKFEPRKIRQ